MPQYDFWRQPYSKDQLAAAAANIVPIISSSGNWLCWNIASMSWKDTGIPAAGKNPYIGSDHYWYVWDAEQNKYVRTDYSVAQDSIQSVNGIFADTGGNVTLPWTGISGANPISKGGTGQTTAPKALYALINGATAIAATGLAAGDYIGIYDVSAVTGKKLTVANLADYLSTNHANAKIKVGSYVGTGTMGAANPVSLSLGFSATVILFLATNNSNNYGKSIWGLYAPQSSGDYNTAAGFRMYISTSSGTTGSISFIEQNLQMAQNAGNLSFYTTESTTANNARNGVGQFNASGAEVTWIALGVA